MKTINKTILIIAAACLVSCNDLLDIKPTTFVSEAVIWEDKALIDQFVANTYGSLVCGFNRNTQGIGQDWSAAMGGNFDSGTDDFDGKFDANVNQFNTGEITAQSTPFIQQIWTSNYQIIRKCNMLIAELPRVADDVLNQEERSRYEAEARFLRAFCYFDLARTFGKAPLILHAQEIDEDLLVAPADFAELVKFISDECDSYYESLYKEVPADQYGRASQGAFLALKARALLYLASPLNNPENDRQRWIDAANAADDVRKLNLYSLYRTGGTPYYSQAFDKSAANKEIIFVRRFQYQEITHNIHMMWSFDAADNPRGSWNGLYPTQNLADAFETVDGKLITDPTSVYDPENPYANRDSRFYQTLIYNGSEWEGKTVRFDINQPNANSARCGYGLKKFIEEHIGPDSDLYTGVYAQDNDWPYFRYAEIQLNYAEAMNEALEAPDDNVYDAVNDVRTRSGQPSLPDGLTKDEMRERIRNERRVELVLEEHRFFDLRRWKDAAHLRETVRGMTVQYDETEDKFIYTIVDIEPRSFSETYYYLPIPQSEVEKNPLLNS